jgi:hypothetical protein
MRWYGRLREDAAELRQPGVGSVIFEVQVITAFEYAWVTVTHDLVYKADNVDWRKQRLAAQLKAAVEQIEVIIAAFDSASIAVLESPWPDSDAKGEVIARCKLLFADGLVPDTLQPASWRRFADNLVSLVRSFEHDPGKLQPTVSRIIDIIDEDLRGAKPFSLPVSGTLFQYVISVIARESSPGNVRRYVIVPSRELSDFYGLTSVPKPFLFDGVSSAFSDDSNDQSFQADAATTDRESSDGQPK